MNYVEKVSQACLHSWPPHHHTAVSSPAQHDAVNLSNNLQGKMNNVHMDVQFIVISLHVVSLHPMQ